jgi:hypothetical protein
MTTTSMRESTIGDAWIHEACMMNPVQNFGGNTFSTGPVRIMYPNVYETSKYQGKDTGKYDATFLFPAYANLTPFYEHIHNLIAEKWPECIQGGQVFGVKTPVRDQGEKVREAAYTPGLKFLKARSKNQPMIYDKSCVLLADKRKLYSGAWVVAHIDIYAPKQSTERMIMAGLNIISLIADDKPLSASGPNPEKARQFVAGVRVPQPITTPQMGAQLPVPQATPYGQPGYGGSMTPYAAPSSPYAPADPYANLSAEDRAMLGL